MCACCGLYGERIEYCGPLVRAGTQYNATTCPARAGLILCRPVAIVGASDLSRTRGVDPAAGSHALGSRDYLRVCGAVDHDASRRAAEQGSSPRVRSGFGDHTQQRERGGIISACAERSRSTRPRPAAAGDHLRVCGAVYPHWLIRRNQEGSSPRVRSGRRTNAVEQSRDGIISACAERSVV